MPTYKNDLRALIAKYTEPDEADAAFSAVLRWTGQRKPNAQLPFLGHGGYASAFLVGKKVLKVTRDIDDVWASAILQNNPDKDLLKVYKVANIVPRTLWVILSEKLTPLSAPQRKKWKAAIPYLRLFSIFHAGLNYDAIMSAEDWIERQERATGVTKETRFVQSLLPRLTIWSDKLSEERGIACRDVSYTNIMMRGRTPIISDLGQSFLESYPSIPTLSY